MSAGDQPPPRVFDAGALESLTGDAADPEIARLFMGRYRSLLPRRIGRILAGLRDEDLDEALDATLSLKASSAMAGAGQLHALARVVEAHLRRSDLVAAAAVAAGLRAAAELVDRELAGYLGA